MSSLPEQLGIYAREKRLATQTLARLQQWPENDQAALLAVARELQLGENHLRDFLDWLEEIVVRDGGTAQDLLMHPDLQRPLETKLSRNDKLKAVKEVLRKIRYPRLSRLEEDLRAAIKALDLSNRVRISFPPVLEGDEITLEIKARNVKELGEGLIEVQQKLVDGSLQRVFELIDEV